MTREDEEEIAAIVAAVRQIPHLGGDESIAKRVGERVAGATPLPAHVREWLAGKSKPELEALDKMLRDYSAAQTIGKFGKWLGLTIAGVFLGSWGLAKAGIEIFAWLKGGGR
ncbi:hypothetical protein [uncultured Enterovirga sp.]|uniref:hypothetical protein n=1 Tax=uncultured Enterovirga sp. TaxID=2026352 RepID=UPI0035CB0AC3